MAFRGFLADGLAVLGFPLEPFQFQLLERFRSLLLSENLTHNLTRLEGDYDFALRHVVDSLTCLTTGLFEGPGSLVDIGSGAGFPGIPLKIARPELSLTLVEASRKRAAFLSKVISELGLVECEVLAERAENVGRDPSKRGSYELAATRAVASLVVDLEYAVPLLTTGGKLVAMKGPRSAGELESAARAARALGAELWRVTELTLPLTRARRLLAVFVKTSSTPDRYPRRPGGPARRPLQTCSGDGRGWATGEETLHSRQ